MLVIREFGYEIEGFLREVPTCSDVYYAIRHVSGSKHPEFKSVFIELSYLSKGDNMLWRARRYVANYVFRPEQKEQKGIDEAKEAILKMIEKHGLIPKYGFLLGEDMKID